MITTKAFSDPTLAMQRIVPIRQAAELAGVSEDTLRRRRFDKIIQISPRRQGMRVCDALMIPEQNSTR